MGIHVLPKRMVEKTICREPGISSKVPRSLHCLSAVPQEGNGGAAASQEARGSGVLRKRPRSRAQMAAQDEIQDLVWDHPGGLRRHAGPPRWQVLDLQKETKKAAMCRSLSREKEDTRPPLPSLQQHARLCPGQPKNLGRGGPLF